MAAVGAAAGLMCKKKVFTVPLCFILAIAFHTLFNISLESEHLPALSPIIILTIGYLCVGKLYSSPFLTQ